MWAFVVLVTLLGGVLAACGDGDGDGATVYEYVIPAGSGERIAAGEQLDILPRELGATVGESIVIRNDDDVAHSVGPWFVGPGETLRQQFLTEGVYEGACSVHPDGAFTVTVGPA